VPQSVIKKELEKYGMDEDWYWPGVLIVGGIVGLGIWIYAFFSWGLLVGLLIGWLPGIIGGIIAGLLWPIVVLGVVGVLLIIFG